MAIFEGVVLNITEGDVITSKEGFLMRNSPITNEDFLVFKMKYLGNGKWEVIGNKEKITSKRVSKN